MTSASLLDFLNRFRQTIRSLSATILGKVFAKFWFSPPKNWYLIEFTDWDNLWRGVRPLLLWHGYRIYDFEDPKFVSRPLPPSTNPRDPFHPKPGENFIAFPPQAAYEPFDHEILKPDHWMACDALGRSVHIQAIPLHHRSIPVLRRLMHSEFMSQPDARVVPVLDAIPWDDHLLVVRPFWDFQWYRLCETGAMRLRLSAQLIEGLACLHRNKIAHGDIHSGNILAAAKIPGAFELLDVHVGYIDFASACCFPLSATKCLLRPDDIPTMPPRGCRAPEQENKSNDPFDPFAADVYNLGATLKLDLGNAIEFDPDTQDMVSGFWEIIASMVQTYPADRITAQQASDRIRSLLKTNIL